MNKKKRSKETMEEVDESNDHQQIISDDSAEGYEYEVFLSFCGEDTRKNFTDHLYSYLMDLRIQTFRDNDSLHVGEKIGPKLMEAIETSKIMIPIFSKNYASSKWCLMELTHMVKWVEMHKDTTMLYPIFYDVTPSEVRNQTGSFQKAFGRHMKKFGKKTVDKWKEALGKVPEVKGWERDKIGDGYESELVKKVGTKVLTELKKKHVEVTEHLVGMDRHEAELMQLLDLDCNDVKIVGIVGMGGIGKTTIARFIYNKLCDDQFHQRCSFLEDVREKIKQSGGLDVLKKQLMSDILKRTSDGVQLNQSTFKNTKALVVVDDVRDRSQLIGIVRKYVDWYGHGSRIIVTTRNRDTFREQEGEKIYEPPAMDSYNALRLFCKHAFRQDCPREGYEDFSEEMVSKVAGLPLSLEVIGSLLSTKTRVVWEDTLKKLKSIMLEDVQERLQISYDMLDDGQKDIFLDIACHFIYSDKDTRLAASYMWEDCGFFPVSGIEVLVTFSLVKIDENGCFWMHDQLRDLGREIVRKQNAHNRGDRSRLWSPEEDLEVLTSKRGTERVETLILEVFWFSPLSNEVFERLSGLRYLDLSNIYNLTGDFKGIFSNLRWFRLQLTSQITEITNFCLPKLVVLDLSGSAISDGWEDLIQIKRATNLKVLDLSRCDKLTKTPDLSAFSKLERLNLQSCSNLAEISPSIGHLQHLSYLNLKCCHKYREVVRDSTSSESRLKLPEFIWNLKSLVELQMQCLHVTELSEAFGNLTNLSILDVGGSFIKKLPSTFGMLAKLEELDAGDCLLLEELPQSVGNLRSLKRLILRNSRVERLPSTIGLLEKLEELDASDCSSLEEFPETIGKLTNMKRLNLCSTAIKKLPAGIEMLQNLERLDCGRSSFEGETSLEGELPSGLWSLSTLRELILRNTRISSLVPADISCCSGLMVLDLRNCPNICLPSRGLKLPPGLERLEIPLTKASLDSVARLPNLKVLGFHQCDRTDLVQFPIDLGGLPHELELKFDGFKNYTSLPVKINNLSSLRVLSIGNGVFYDFGIGLLALDCCGFLERLPDLPNTLKRITICSCPNLSNFDSITGLRSLEELSLENCPSLDRLPDLSTLNRLVSLGINGCEKLQRIHNCTKLSDGGGLTSLVDLHIKNCPSLESLPDSSTLNGLVRLSIDGCEKLGRIHNYQLSKVDSIAGLTSLKELSLENCPSLDSLPDLSTLNCLVSLRINGCEKLQRIHNCPKLSDGGDLTSLVDLHIKNCPSLESLPDSSTLNDLVRLSIDGCEKLGRIHNYQVSKVDSIAGLTSLEELSLENCPSLDSLPDLSTLNRLVSLGINGCEKLQRIHNCTKLSDGGGLTSLVDLHIKNCPSLESLPDSSTLNHLVRLSIDGCEKLGRIHNYQLSKVDSIAGLTSLEMLSIENCPSLDSLPDLSTLNRLVSLRINGCEKLQRIHNSTKLSDGGGLTSLVDLHIKNCPSLESLPDSLTLNDLVRLSIDGCEKLQRIHNYQLSKVDSIAGLTSLEELSLENCPSLDSLPDLSTLNHLVSLRINGCEKLQRIHNCPNFDVESLGGLISLKELSIENCSSIDTLPDLSTLNRLESLSISKCEKLRIIHNYPKLSDVDGIVGLTSLEEVSIEDCPFLDSLPDLSTLNGLVHLRIVGCEKLRRIKGLEALTCLENLRLKDCPSLEKLPPLSLKSKSWIKFYFKNCGPDNESLDKESQEELEFECYWAEKKSRIQWPDNEVECQMMQWNSMASFLDDGLW